MHKVAGQLQYSPRDLIRYLASPFASWMDRYPLEHRGLVTPDKATEEERLIAQTGEEHERAVLDDLKSSNSVIEIPKDDPTMARERTRSALSAKTPVIYQAALASGPFAGFADFLLARRAPPTASSPPAAATWSSWPAISGFRGSA